jgi:pyruvate/2-oxoglutarate dehydrogenase complex dihydrolipoamide dehydrogenase (E3) component
VRVKTLATDLLIIGFGKGGKAIAADAGGLGRRVALVEQSDRMYGGTCPNVGCVPSKGLVHRSAKRRPTDPPQAFYERAVREVQDVREMMRLDNFNALNNAETVTVLTGRTEFIDAHTVRVEGDDGEMSIVADEIIIDTGSEPIIPDIPGLRESPHMVTSGDLMETTVLPKRLAIVGGGGIGIEFAGIYRGFGSEVTLFESAPAILDGEDDEVAAVAEQILRDEGVEIVVNAEVVEVRDNGPDATVVYETDGRRRTLAADAILAAAGRKPATDDLGLEAAGVRTTDRGAVEVDEHLRTSQPHIYALGDADGGPQHTYISLDDGRIVMDQLAGEGARSTADRVAVPRTLFITPPFASVGLTEKEAREAGYEVRVSGQAVADIVAMPRAYAVEETRGMMKFVIDADTDEILGAALLSVDAQELINLVALAMRHGIKAAELGDAVYTHPSSTEAFNDLLRAPVRDREAPAGEPHATLT